MDVLLAFPALVLVIFLATSLDALDIPVLTTTGYYDGGQLGALHTFAQHQRHRPGAEHYLVVGPYSGLVDEHDRVRPGPLPEWPTTRCSPANASTWPYP